MVYSNLLVLVKNINSYNKNLHHYIPLDTLKNTNTKVSPYIHYIRYNEDKVNSKEKNRANFAKSEMNKIFENNTFSLISKYKLKESEEIEIPSIMLNNLFLLKRDITENLNKKLQLQERLNTTNNNLIKNIDRKHIWKNEKIYTIKELGINKNKYLSDIIYEYIRKNSDDSFKNESVYIIILEYNILFTNDECKLIKQKIENAINILDNSIDYCNDSDSEICKKHDELYDIISKNVELVGDKASKNVKSFFNPSASSSSSSSSKKSKKTSPSSSKKTAPSFSPLFSLFSSSSLSSSPEAGSSKNSSQSAPSTTTSKKSKKPSPSLFSPLFSLFSSSSSSPQGEKSPPEAGSSKKSSSTTTSTTSPTTSKKPSPLSSPPSPSLFSPLFSLFSSSSPQGEKSPTTAKEEVLTEIPSSMTTTRSLKPSKNQKIQDLIESSDYHINVYSNDSDYHDIWRDIFDLPKNWLGPRDENPDINCCQLKGSITRKNPWDGNSSAFIEKAQDEKCNHEGWIELKGLGHELYYNKCNQNFKIERPDQIKTQEEKQEREERDIEKNMELFKEEYQKNNIQQVLPYNGFFFENTYNNFITNYKIRDFGGGGDCLFHAIAGVLNLKYDLSGAYTLDHIFVRNEIVKKMKEIYDNDDNSYPFVRKEMNSIENISDYMEQMLIYSTGENEGTWGETLEIAIATLVDFRRNKTEGTTPIRVNIHILQKKGNTTIIEARRGKDVDIKEEERSFSQSFIQKDNQEGIIIYNNGNPDVVESGTHYQGVIPQHDKEWNDGKVPFIYWNFLDSIEGSGKKSKKKKRKKTKKNKRKTKKGKKRNTKKRKPKKQKLNI